MQKRLAGGDCRTIGEADRVASEAQGNPAAIAELVKGFEHADPVVRMRAADALDAAASIRARARILNKQLERT